MKPELKANKSAATTPVGSGTVLNSVYDALVKIGGASESMRENFILCHQHNIGCEEYRFMGELGFGGKYWSRTNRVTCHSGDETPKRLAIIRELNDALAKLSNAPMSGTAKNL